MYCFVQTTLCFACRKFAPLSHDSLAAVVRTIQGPKLCSEFAGAKRVMLSLVLLFPCIVMRCSVGGPVVVVAVAVAVDVAVAVAVAVVVVVVLVVV